MTRPLHAARRDLSLLSDAGLRRLAQDMLSLDQPCAPLGGDWPLAPEDRPLPEVVTLVEVLAMACPHCGKEPKCEDCPGRSGP